MLFRTKENAHQRSKNSVLRDGFEAIQRFVMPMAIGIVANTNSLDATASPLT